MLSLTYSLADQDFLATKSVGIFNFSIQLLKALAVLEGDLELEVLANSTLIPRLDLPATVPIRLHDEAIGGRIRRIWWDQWQMYRVASQLRKDWVFLPKGFASFMRGCPVKLATYVHDTILESYYRDHPGVSALERLYFERSLSASLKQSGMIFTNSDFTRRELIRAASRRGITPPSIVNAGIGFNLPPSTTQSRVDEIMVLAGAFPHKRTDLAINYLARWQRETNYRGNIEWVGRLPAGLSFPDFPNWRLNTRLSHAEYESRMQRSRVLIFFSDYEGFGMPPVEAVLSGMCPVYSEIEATREVMLDAGCPFQNNSYESFERALKTALLIPPSQLDTWKRRLASRFNWPTVRSRILEPMGSAGG